MDRRRQSELADRFRAMHGGPELLVLPNVWDPLGARVVEANGFPAIATASAAISASLGYHDGEQLSRATVIALLERIANSVELPVTADLEAGYGATLAELHVTVQQAIEAGVVGINLEDSLEHHGDLRAIDEQCARISAARDVARETGVPIVINARVDCFLGGEYASNDARMAEAILRGNAYSAAGADCIYPIGPGDRDSVVALRAGIEAPLNILGSARSEPLAVLEALAVNRVTFGPFLHRAWLQQFLGFLKLLREDGDYTCFTHNMVSQADANEYLMVGPEGSDEQG